MLFRTKKTLDVPGPECTDVLLVYMYIWVETSVIKLKHFAHMDSLQDKNSPTLILIGDLISGFVQCQVVS